MTWPNTLKAHQLIAYVTDPNRQINGGGDKPTTSECNAVIFDEMYERGKNISLVETLVAIARERLGITDDEIPALTKHLQDNVGAKEVIKEIQTGRRRYSISGVPYFIVGADEGEGNYVGRPYGFSGAQDSGTFVEIFEEFADKLG